MVNITLLLDEFSSGYQCSCHTSSQISVSDLNGLVVGSCRVWWEQRVVPSIAKAVLETRGCQGSSAHGGGKAVQVSQDHHRIPEAEKAL